MSKVGLKFMLVMPLVVSVSLGLHRNMCYIILGNDICDKHNNILVYIKACI